MTPELYDLTILGSGPTGMYAAYYAGFRKLKTQVIDSLNEVGGQITALYPEKAIYDVAGFPEIQGKELVKNLYQQMMQYHPHLVMGAAAIELHKEPDGTFHLRTSKGDFRTKAIIIASGLGIMNPRKLENRAWDRFEGHGLAYIMQNPDQYRGKKVVIIGGGDSAVDWANHLAPIASKVYVVHRRDEFRAHEDSVEKMRAHAIVKTPYQLKDIQGGGKIERIVITGGPTGGDETIEADAVLAFLGFLTTPGPVAKWGIDLEKDDVKINQRTETSIPGIFAIGDCASYPGKVKLASVGFGEAAIAVNHAAVFIDPKKRVFPGHSSNAK